MSDPLGTSGEPGLEIGPWILLGSAMVLAGVAQYVSVVTAAIIVLVVVLGTAGVLGFFLWLRR